MMDGTPTDDTMTPEERERFHAVLDLANELLDVVMDFDPPLGAADQVYAAAVVAGYLTSGCRRYGVPPLQLAACTMAGLKQGTALWELTLRT